MSHALNLTRPSPSNTELAGDRFANRVIDPDDPFAEPDQRHLDPDDPFVGPGDLRPKADIPIAEPAESLAPTFLYQKRVFDPLMAQEALDEPGQDDLDTKVKARRDWLTRMAADPRGGNRDLVRPTPAILSSLERLAADSGHCQRLFDLILASARATQHTGQPMRWPPILLLGAPGIGKTFIAREIAARMGLPFEVLSMPNQSGSGVLGGLDTSWRNPKIGLVAKTLIVSSCASPLFLLDELEKTPGRNGEFGDPLGPLYDLLEPGSAIAYEDDFLKLRFATDRVFWLSSANDLTPLPAPLLDRFIVVALAPPSEAQMRAILDNIYSELSSQWAGWFASALSADASRGLRRHHPRRVRRLLGIALTLAAGDGRHSITVEDIGTAAKIAISETSKPKIGFL